MNQDQVKTLLLQIREDVDYFDLIFSGKSSKRVDGLYKPVEREIIIHNKNMESDTEIMYTAIHEFAHHIQFTRNPERVFSRAHTQEFWGLFHTLLEEAEKAGVYTNPYEQDPVFLKLTKEIKAVYLEENGALVERLSDLLINAVALCKEHHVSFEDYFERILGIERTTAHTMLKVSTQHIPSNIGFDNMKTLAGIPDREKRQTVLNAMQNGSSPAVIKTKFLNKTEPDDPKKYLEQERVRVEKRINSLQQKLEMIDQRLTKYE